MKLFKLSGLLSLALFWASTAHADSITQTLSETIGTFSNGVNFAAVFGVIDIHIGIDQLQWSDLYQVSTISPPSELIELTDIINPTALVVADVWRNGELTQTFQNFTSGNLSSVTIPEANPPTFTVNFDGHVYSFPPLSENFIITPTSITQVGSFGVPEPSTLLLLLGGAIFALPLVRRIK